MRIYKMDAKGEMKGREGKGRERRGTGTGDERQEGEKEED